MLLDPHIALTLTTLWVGVFVLAVPALVALLLMRRRQVEPVTQVLWVGVVLCFPLVGTLAFLVLRPGARRGPVAG